VPIVVTPRAIEVLRRALDAGRMDATRVGVRIAAARGMRGGDVRTTFAEEPEPGDETIDAEGIRLYVAAELATSGAVVDVADEHDRIVLRNP
jgi:Fe-S cluster assembly iron-binding protein IscA